jgi:hypothetical protein
MTRPPKQFYEQAQRMNYLVFEVCSRLRNLEPCKGCPHVMADERHGPVHKGCRLMAEETIAVVLEAAAIEAVEIWKS